MAIPVEPHGGRDAAPPTPAMLTAAGEAEDLQPVRSLHR